MITISRTALATELALMAAVVKGERTVPILTTVKLDFHDGVLHLTATNYNSTLTTQVEATGDAWSGCVPWGQLHRLVKAMDCEHVVLKAQSDSRVKVVGGGSYASLPVYEAGKFPETNYPNTVQVFAVNGDVFRQAVERVLPAVSDSEGKWAMVGVNIECDDEGLRLVATDEARIAIARLPPVGVTATALIPKGGLLPLLKLPADNIGVEVGRNAVWFTCGERRLSTRLLTTRFPAWAGIVPKESANSITVDSASLLAAFKRAAVTREETFKLGVGVILGGMRFTFNGALTLEVPDNARGGYTEAVATEGECAKTVTAFSPEYITDFLHTGEGVCQVTWQKADTMFGWSWPDDASFQYLVAPRRV